MEFPTVFSKMILVFALIFVFAGTVLSKDSTLGIRAISFNIRMNFADDGINNWENRKQLVIETLQNRNADLIGMQEVTSEQYLFLKDQLTGYNSYAVGRKDGALEDEIMAIFYKPNFDLLADSTIWLSENPTEVGSKSWDAALYRTVSWIRVKDPESGVEFSFYNTHFDHRGQVAREQSAKLIHRLIAETANKKPFILAGDFNIIKIQEPYKILTSIWKGCYLLRDARDVSAKPHEGGEVTYNGFKDEGGSIIDFIFVSDGITVHEHRYLNVKQGDVFISDHYPVEATLVVGSKSISRSGKGYNLY